MKKTEQKDDAVSPVVGVMLMLVVTIIIAAVVAAFASGVTADVEPVPNAVLKAEVDSTWGADADWLDGSGNLFLTSLNGDPINLKKVSILIYNSTGHFATYVSPSHGFASKDVLESGETLNLVYAAGYKSLTSAGVTLKSGELAQVIIIYDDSHILYDKEVLVQ